MKQVTIRIRINEETQRVAFRIDRNNEDNVNDILKLVGVLDLIKKAQLEKIAELARIKT